MTKPPFDLAVYLVVGPSDCAGRSLTDVVQAALAGGVTLVQLRDKKAEDAPFIELGRALLPLCRAAGAPLIVNDRLEAALAIDADGVHVGQEDLAASDVRNRLGPDRILGVSAGTPEELERVPQTLVDYLGVGPFNPTNSKEDAGEAIGTAGIAAIRGQSRLPLVGIGGIRLCDVGEVIRAGARGVAVVSAIAAAPDPKQAASDLKRAVLRARDQV